MVKKVSVIIPTFNAADYLQNIISDLEKQTYEAAEFVFVDDASTDNTVSVFNSLIGDNKKFKLLTTSHAGQSAARNYGLDHITGDYVMFIDCDDRVHPKYIERLVTILQNSDADIAEVSYVVSTDVGDNAKLGIKKNSKYVELKKPVSELLYSTLVSNINSAPVWNKIYKIELFKNERFPVDNNQSEDLWLNVRLFHKAHRIVKSSDSLYFYYQNPSSSLHRPVTHKDMEILETHQLIIDFIKDNYGPEKEEKLAEIKLARSYYSLLLRCLRNHVQATFNRNDFNVLKQNLEANFNLLIKSPMSLNRKIVLIILYAGLRSKIINFEVIKWIS